MKRAAATEAFKKLEAPVHWLAFLSAQHHFEVQYQIYEEAGVKVCCVYVDGCEAAPKVECPVKGPGPIMTEEDMRAAAAKGAIEGIEQRITADSTMDMWEADWVGSSDEDWK
jgi:hypothetical protein